MLLFSGIVAVTADVTKLQQSIGTNSYQVGEELEVYFSFSVSTFAHVPPIGKPQEVLAAYAPVPHYLPLLRQSSEGVLDCKRTTGFEWLYH